MGTRYKDSRNSKSIEEGAEFVDLVLTYIGHYYSWFPIPTRSLEMQLGYSDTIGGIIEFKLDNRCTETKRLSIEVEERKNNDSPWMPSGIYAPSEPIFYAQGNLKCFWIFKTKALQENDNKNYEINPRTVKKFYISLDIAAKLSFIGPEFTSYFPIHVGQIQELKRKQIGYYNK